MKNVLLLSKLTLFLFLLSFNQAFSHNTSITTDRSSSDLSVLQRIVNSNKGLQLNRNNSLSNLITNSCNVDHSCISIKGADIIFRNRSTLPVHLLYVKGKAINRSALLEWGTSGEIDNDYFDIERSINGITFSKIGTVKGNGSTSVRQTYQFTDECPVEGTNYYRVKQVDTNLESIYSGIISVQITESLTGISLFPNPASYLVFVKINGIEKDDIELNLMDQCGKIYKSMDLTCKKGENNFSINIQDLPKGLYYINLSGRNKQSLKFFKM